MRAGGVALGAVALAVAAAGCADTGKITRDAASRDVQVVDPALLPAEIAGLAVKPEEVAQAQQAKDAFVDRIGLFGLRKGEELQATLQVSRYNAKAKVVDPSALLTGIGTQSSSTLRMGAARVTFASTAQQTLALWQDGRWLYVLSIREEYTTPRDLVRAALGVHL